MLLVGICDVFVLVSLSLARWAPATPDSLSRPTRRLTLVILGICQSCHARNRETPKRFCFSTVDPLNVKRSSNVDHEILLKQLIIESEIIKAVWSLAIERPR